MKTRIKDIIIVFILGFIACQMISCKKNQPTQPETESVRDISWGKDLEYLDTQMKAKEYEFSSLISPQVFDNTINNIKNSVDSLPDYEIYIKIQQLIASLHVAHITAIPSAAIGTSLHSLPIRTKVFPDGVYIMTTDQNDANLLGKKLISIGGIPIQTVEDSLKSILSYENNYWLEHQIPAALEYTEILKYFGFTKSLSEAELGIEGIGNVELKSEAESNNTVKYVGVLDGKTIPLYMQNVSSNYWFTFIKDSKVLYIKYNACEESPNISFVSFTNNLVYFIDTNNVGKIVIDLRNNGGGSDAIINPLLNYIKSSTYNKTGKLFVLINNGTFSSAELDGIYFKQTTNCLLIGTPTGGKPNSYGNINYFTLPNSKITIYYCTSFIHGMNGDPEALFPDYNIETSFQDYINCKDPVLDFILNYQ